MNRFVGEIGLYERDRAFRKATMAIMPDIYEPVVSGVRVGDILEGKFRIEGILGTGGMGVVVAAHHLQLDEKVAIKFLLADALEYPDAAARFLREAKAAVRIKSEHVGRVSDVGTLDNGAPYMVMEYLEGSDLARWLQQRGVLPIGQAVEFVLQALEAIADAHSLGIIHRDLKPANLFCIRRSDGLLSIKVLDFGISKFEELRPKGPQMDITASAAIMGSPRYMSPEQMRSARDVDARTDIWAVGIILYELLTGTTPFNGDTFPEICARATADPPPPIGDKYPDISRELESVILKCLEKNRDDRFSNVAQLAAALTSFAPERARPSVERIRRIISTAGLSVNESAPPPNSNHTGLARHDQADANWDRTMPRARSLRMVAIGVLVFLPVLAFGRMYLLLRNNATLKTAAASVVQPSASFSVPLPETVGTFSGPVNRGSERASSAAYASGGASETQARSGSSGKSKSAVDDRRAPPPGRKLARPAAELPDPTRDLFASPH